MAKTFWEKEKKELEDTFINKKDSKSAQKRQQSRFNKNWKQFQERGFSDSDLWSLDAHIGQLLAPRLIEFKKIALGQGVPHLFIEKQKMFKDVEKLKNNYFKAVQNEKMSEKEKLLIEKKYKEQELILLDLASKDFEKELDVMIEGFSIIASQEYYNHIPENEIKIKLALESFAKYFTCLWY